MSVPHEPNTNSPEANAPSATHAPIAIENRIIFTLFLCNDKFIKVTTAKSSGNRYSM